MMIGGVDDDEGSLQRVPFALLDVESRGDELATVDARSCLPGLIEETEKAEPTTAFWRSSTSRAAGFPREIALRVLSSAHYRVHAIRIVFPKAKRPSRLEVFAASDGRSSHKRSHGLQPLDTLSQYFCASFEHVTAALTWSPESALDWLLSPTEVTIPIPATDKWQLETPEFIRFFLYQPYPHPENPQDEVVISELELLGTFQLPGRSIPLLEDDIAPKDAATQPEDTGDDIRSLLKAAGLSEELIQELLQPPGDTPESALPSIVSTTPETSSEEPQPLQETPQQAEYLLDSVFDLALRDHINHKRHQDELFASLATPRAGFQALMDETEVYSSGDGLVGSLSLGSIRRNDRNHFEAVATHTFGSFFTQCLVHEDNELRVTSLQVAERFAPLLPLAGLSLELVYEGLVAVILLATESQHRTVSLSVFHAALHLVQTTFQERRTTFRLVGELSKGNINTGLQTIVDAFIQLPHCWSLGAKTTINRELLKTARLLLSQETTRTSFILAVCQPLQGKPLATGSLATVNRLRLIRWLLQRHREKLSGDDFAAIHRVCEERSENNTGSMSSKVGELQQQIKTLVGSGKPAKGDLNAQLQAVKRHLEEQDANQAADQAQDSHIPLFDAYPLTKQEQEVFIDRLRQYFQLHPRPKALYQHEFTMASLEDHATRGEFRKGNIVFKGQVEERVIPVVSFHEHVESKAKSFKFNTPRAGDGATTTQVTMETAFAKFRGTLEVRTTPAPAVKLEPVVATTMPSSVQSPPPSTAQPRKPTPPIARRSSNPKLNRVVPVDSTSSSATDVIPAPGSSTSDVVAVKSSVTRLDTPEQRASTAVPVMSSTNPTAPPVTGVSSAAVDPAPSAPPIKPTKPKTAPAGKSRNSASQSDAGANGCIVQ